MVDKIISYFRDLKKRLMKHPYVNLLLSSNPTEDQLVNATLGDEQFVKTSCKKAGIVDIDGDILTLIKNCKDKATKFNIPEDSIFSILVTNIDILKQNNDDISNLIASVRGDVIKKAEELDVEWILYIVHNIACGAIAKYILKSMKNGKLLRY